LPLDTVDPSPYVHNETMFYMAGIQTLAVVSNFLLRPIDSSLHEKVNAPTTSPPALSYLFPPSDKLQTAIADTA
jgi:hypothetical protein